MYPCPCGYKSDPVKECICSNSVITRYQKRNSGLMLDRIDFYTEVQRVEYDKLGDDRLEEKLSGVQVRVEAARQINENVCGRDELRLRTYHLQCRDALKRYLEIVPTR